ncbi:MAG: hypothetical protein ACI3VA_12475 [Candidatus Limivicinus sp.]
MNADCKKNQPKEGAKGKFTKQDVWDLLGAFVILLIVMLIRYAIFLPRFL